MGTLTLAGLLEECSRRGIRLEPKGDHVVCRTPREQSRDSLAAELVEHKAALLAILQPVDCIRETLDSHVTLGDRRAAYQAVVVHVNARFVDGPINWPLLDRIAATILNAATLRELTAALADYEATALNLKRLHLIPT